ncbi:hypothetical protein ACHAXS_002693 [Conticribra weissflogii]
MIKSFIFSAIGLSLAAISCQAQLSSIPKRFRQNIVVDEKHILSDSARESTRTNEFGRRAYKVNKIERQLGAESESSMSFSMRRLGELSMSMSIDYSMSMADVEEPILAEFEEAVPVIDEKVDEDIEAIERAQVEEAVSSGFSIRLSMLALLPVACFFL